MTFHKNNSQKFYVKINWLDLDLLLGGINCVDIWLFEVIWLKSSWLKLKAIFLKFNIRFFKFDANWQCAQKVWGKNRHPHYQKSPQIATLKISQNRHILGKNRHFFEKKSYKIKIVLCTVCGAVWNPHFCVKEWPPLSFLLHFYATIFWKM